MNISHYLDAVIVHARVGDAVVVLGVDPEVVLLVDGEVPDAAVGVGAVVADLGPTAGALLGPLDDVVGDGGAAVLERRAPVESEGLAGEVGAVDVARRLGTVQDGNLEGGRVVARVVGQPQP